DVKAIVYDKGDVERGIGVATGETRAAEAARKAISAPLVETSIDAAHGILVSITGGTNDSLVEVEEAADLVTSAVDEGVNATYGSVIDEKLKDEIVVRVIATGFEEKRQADKQPRQRSVISHNQHESTRTTEESMHDSVFEERIKHDEDTLDIPTFLRNRNRRR